ncbi:MAG TPA: chemotaxis protein CheX [Verrucomicrobiae bacterium]|nr:chemotaxis protein CheX [Verrucomicrobiae bacterium]
MTTDTIAPDKTGAQLQAADNSLVEAVVSTIASVCKTQATPKAQRAEVRVDGEKIIASVSLVGDVEMTVFLGMPSATAVALAEKFAGFKVPFESPDMADAIGELGNMIAGDLKIRLDRSGLKANISLPTVFRGQDLTVTTPKWEIIRDHFFGTPSGDFMAGLCSRKLKP